jgi:hypothetical protein
MTKKSQTVVVEKNTYINGIMVDKKITVIEPGPDWVKRIILSVAIPLGFWMMAMGGMFA